PVGLSIHLARSLSTGRGCASAGAGGGPARADGFPARTAPLGLVTGGQRLGDGPPVGTAMLPVRGDSADRHVRAPHLGTGRLVAPLACRPACRPPVGVGPRHKAGAHPPRRPETLAARSGRAENRPGEGNHPISDFRLRIDDFLSILILNLKSEIAF